MTTSGKARNSIGMTDYGEEGGGHTSMSLLLIKANSSSNGGRPKNRAGYDVDINAPSRICNHKCDSSLTFVTSSNVEIIRTLKTQVSDHVMDMNQGL